jgi:hypothetical protein
MSSGARGSVSVQLNVIGFIPLAPSPSPGDFARSVLTNSSAR